MNLIGNDKFIAETHLYIRWITIFFSITLLFFIFVPQVHASTNNDANLATSSTKSVNLATSSTKSINLGSSSIKTGFVPLAPIPGLTKGVTADTPGLATYLNNLYKFIIGLSAVLAVIYIIWGGLEIATQDSISKHAVGKQRIEQAILGLVLVLSPVLVFSIINPNILNLSLNLPVLDTQSGRSFTYNYAPHKKLTCDTKGKKGILQTAFCFSEKNAANWGQKCTGNLKEMFVFGDPTTSHYLVTCSGTKNYTFVMGPTSLFTTLINELQPLAQTKTNPNNGASAVQFAKICADIGARTCISKGPETPCTQGTCYTEVLSCKNHYIKFKKFSTCDKNPSWIPVK